MSHGCKGQERVEIVGTYDPRWSQREISTKWFWRKILTIHAFSPNEWMQLTSYWIHTSGQIPVKPATRTPKSMNIFAVSKIFIKQSMINGLNWLDCSWLLAGDMKMFFTSASKTRLSNVLESAFSIKMLNRASSTSCKNCKKEISAN